MGEFSLQRVCRSFVSRFAGHDAPGELRSAAIGHSMEPPASALLQGGIAGRLRPRCAGSPGVHPLLVFAIATCDSSFAARPLVKSYERAVRTKAITSIGIRQGEATWRQPDLIGDERKWSRASSLGQPCKPNYRPRIQSSNLSTANPLSTAYSHQFFSRASNYVRRRAIGPPPALRVRSSGAIPKTVNAVTFCTAVTIERQRSWVASSGVVPWQNCTSVCSNRRRISVKGTRSSHALPSLL